MPTRLYKHKVTTNNKKKKAQQCDEKTAKQRPQTIYAKKEPIGFLSRLLFHNSEDIKLREKHCVFPAFNESQLPLQSIDELCLYPSYTAQLPCPIYIANKHCERVDICHRRTMEREIYRKRLHISQTRYHTVQKDKKCRTNIKEHIYHTSFFDLAKRLELDPDPYFHGSYDYYYSGGNLCLLGDNEHVVHVDGKHLNNLNVGVVPKSRTTTCKYLDPICSHKLDSEVFEVSAIQSVRPGYENCFVVRQRDSITIRALNENGKMKALCCFQNKYTPFISFAQSPTDLSSFVVSTMKQCICMYDLETAAPVLTVKHDICPKTDPMCISWNMVRPWQGQTFIYANEKQFLLSDMRTTPEQWLKNSYDSEDQEFACDFISSIANSNFSNLAYVATNHKLHCLDLRFLRDDFDAIARWTHQLEYAPACVETFRNSDVEIIAMSSALADDTVICELTRAHKERVVTNERSETKVGRYVYKSYCLPYQLPTLAEAYQLARVSGKCLQPDADLPSRISRCSTGLAFYGQATADECTDEKGNNAFAVLLTSNSIGDVYAHRLIDRKTQEPEARFKTETFSEDSMNEYAKGVCEFTQPGLNYTEVVNLKAMRKVFRCNVLSVPHTMNAEPDIITEATSYKRHALGRWQKPIQTLHSYKDALVKDLLNVWDIEYEVDNKMDTSFTHIKKEFIVQVDPQNAVNSWLNSNTEAEANLESSVMTVVHASANNDMDASIKMDTSIEGDGFINDSKFACLDILRDLSTQQQSTQIVDDIADSLPLMQEEFISLKPKSKPVKKKTKYVKGF